MIEYRRNRQPATTVALLREYVPNQGQAWELALGAVGRYLEEVSGRARPARRDRHRPRPRRSS